VGAGEVRLLVLLTKADKLNRKEAAQALAQAQAVLGEAATEHADISVALFSALKRQGVGDAAITLHHWLQAGPPLPLPEAGEAEPPAPAAPPAPLAPGVVTALSAEEAMRPPPPLSPG
jgi:GTP-binding protein